MDRLQSLAEESGNSISDLLRKSIDLLPDRSGRARLSA
jgi:hypothetical protein